MNIHIFKRLILLGRLFLLVLVVEMVASCQAVTSPPPLDPDKTRVIYSSNSFDQFTAVAQLVPGFGGMYFDRQNNFNVYLSGASWNESQIDPTTKEQNIRSALIQVYGKDLAQNSTFIFVQGKYDIIQLIAWYVAIRDIPDTELSVGGISLDEMNNRIVLGLYSPIVSLVELETTITSRGVPLQALVYVYYF